MMQCNMMQYCNNYYPDEVTIDNWVENELDFFLNSFETVTVKCNPFPNHNTLQQSKVKDQIPVLDLSKYTNIHYLELHNCVMKNLQHINIGTNKIETLKIVYFCLNFENHIVTGQQSLNGISKFKHLVNLEIHGVTDLRAVLRELDTTTMCNLKTLTLYVCLTKSQRQINNFMNDCNARKIICYMYFYDNCATNHTCISKSKFQQITEEHTSLEPFFLKYTQITTTAS